MDEILPLVFGFFLGVCLGVFFFGGLWLTTRRLQSCRQPALLTLGSFIGRSVICLLGFYLALGRGLTALLLSLMGFVLTKIIIVHCLGCGKMRSEMDG
jgi:F1F0 ATPase subunit 2